MKPLHILFAIAVALCWGANFAASKYAVSHFEPVFTILIRYALVTLVLLPFFRIAPLPFKQLSILALLMCTLHFSLVFSALWMGLDVASTVIAIQMGTPFSVVLGTIFLNDKLGAWRASGMAIAFMGVVMVAGSPQVDENWIAFLIAVAGAFCWAASNIYMKQLGEVDVMPLLAWSSLASLPQLLVISLLIESNHLTQITTAPHTAWNGILYSAVFSTMVGYGLWYYLLKKYAVSQVAPFALLVPFAGISSGIIFFNEALSPTLFIGAALTILGVAIITFRKPKLVGRVGKV